MTKKTMTTNQALSIISEVITFYFEIRGKDDDKKELAWRKQIEDAENLINQKLTKNKEAA